MANVFSTAVFSAQVSDFYQLWDINSEIHETEILDLLKTSYMLGENRTGAIAIKRFPGLESFQSTGIYIYLLVPQSGMIPWRVDNNTTISYMADGSYYTPNYTTARYSYPYPFISGQGTRASDAIRAGALVEDINLYNTPAYGFTVGAFWTPIVDSKFTYRTSESVAGCGNIAAANVIDDHDNVFINTPNGNISPAMFDLIYKNARRAAITPQILISIPYNDEGYSVRYIDPLYNKSMLLKTYNGLVPFESETLANGDYWLYLFWQTKTTRNSYPFGENKIKCAYIEHQKIVLTKKTSTYGNLYVGRIPSIPNDGSKYTRKRISFNIKDQNDNEIAPATEQWQLYTTWTYTYRVSFVAWIGGYSKELCNGVP